MIKTFVLVLFIGIINIAYFENVNKTSVFDIDLEELKKEAFSFTENQGCNWSQSVSGYWEEWPGETCYVMNWQFNCEPWHSTPGICTDGYVLIYEQGCGPGGTLDFSEETYCPW